MATHIKYIIAEGADVNFFSTKKAAESYYEAIDVKEGIFRGYDSDGRLLQIRPCGQASKISLAEHEPLHREELRVLLIEVLTRRGRPPADAALDALLTMCEPYLRN